MAAAAAAVRVASVLREMSGDAEDVEPDDDSEEIMQGVIRRLNAEAASLAPRRPSCQKAALLSFFIVTVSMWTLELPLDISLKQHLPSKRKSGSVDVVQVNERASCNVSDLLNTLDLRSNCVFPIT